MTNCHQLSADLDNSTILCSIRRVEEARQIVMFERGTGVEKGCNEIIVVRLAPLKGKTL